MGTGASFKPVQTAQLEGISQIRPRERFVYLDLIKTMAIYLVCFYHFNNLPIDILNHPSFFTYLNYGILGMASAGVPLFFMVNGALMLNRSYSLRKHVYRIIMICILTVVWGILTLAVLIPIKGDSYTAVQFVKALLEWKQYRINHLWFLQTLVCLYILFPLIKEVYDKKEKGPLYFFFGAAFLLTFGNVFLSNLANTAEWVMKVNYLEKNYNFFNNFNVFSGFYAFSIVYFILGGWLQAKLLKNRFRRPGSPVLTGIILTALIALLGYGLIMSQSNGDVFDTVFDGYDTLMTLIVTAGLFILSSRYQQGKSPRLSKGMEVIGSNTLGIYFIHVIVGWFTLPYYKLLPFSTNLLANLIYGAAVLILSLGVVLLLKKIPVVKLLFQL
ncbi:acyltransferase [Paenibacillus sp. 7124]|uniref:Acyltransferase n=1 Tax=Paenibacillus apii TaxID=1850370 RepID=A0A6M1PNG0_9BACL|nr:acyltransferase [Paenibacillus apii]NGM85247.1 acyltransferase [Paenibacillus apii]NJJ42117.1 acyltransferase [Paenibacillus apii]